MSDTVWQRREAAAARLQSPPAPALGKAADQELAEEVLRGDIGLQIDEVDPTGGLRESVLSVVLVAASRPGFDVALSVGPGHDWAARVLSTASGIQVSLQQVEGTGPSRLAPTAQSLTVGVTGSPPTAIFWGR